MSHIEVTIPETITQERRIELVKNLTDTIGNILHFTPESRKMISIRLDLYGKNEIARAGVLVEDKKPGLYHLDVFCPQLEYQQKRELVEHLTNAFSDSLRLGGDERRLVFVTLHEFKPENVSMGGRLMTEAMAAV